eukprot:TRINITY_DN2004_c0_g1_i4.p2 TRINITY_DN2004_c0_g1~~TRINITY_DN2004_c0_g1_i4.p2  ORF type:complete len:551 (-),score=20.08 TRINITY_DN2004_c0_g1_i4:6710-8362(-)
MLHRLKWVRLAIMKQLSSGRPWQPPRPLFKELSLDWGRLSIPPLDPGPVPWVALDGWLTLIKEAIRILRREFRAETSARFKASSRAFAEKLHQETANPASFFQRMSSTLKSGGPPSVLRDNGELHWDPEKVSEVMHDFYSGLYGQDQKRKPPPEGKKWMKSPVDDEQREHISARLLAPVTEAELQAVLGRLPSHKAPGPDHLPAEVWSHLSPANQVLLRGLYDRCIQHRLIPKDWLHGVVYSIHKGGDTADLANYRPITLLDTVVLEELGVLSDSQKGFRKGRSIAQHHQTFFSILSEVGGSDKIKSLHAVWIDLIKAFDSARHWALLMVLAYYLNAAALALIMAMLVGARLSVITAYGMTPEFEAHRGVRQGDPISPILFILLLDLGVKWIEDSSLGFPIRGGPIRISILLYADDILLISESRAGVEKLLDMLGEYLQWLAFDIGASKSAYSTTDPNPTPLPVPNSRAVFPFLKPEDELEQATRPTPGAGCPSPKRHCLLSQSPSETFGLGNQHQDRLGLSLLLDLDPLPRWLPEGDGRDPRPNSGSLL